MALSGTTRLTLWYVSISSLLGCVGVKVVSPGRHIDSVGHPNLPTIVFVHGVYHDSWAFEEFKKPFQQASYSVSLVDLRGHGMEPEVKPDSDVGYVDYVHDVATALDEINGKKILIGHSLGGLIALSLAERDDLAAIVLLSTPLPEAVKNKQVRLLTEFPIGTLKFLLTGDAAYLYHCHDFTDRYFFSIYTDEQVKKAANERIQAQDEPVRVFKDIMRLKFTAGRCRVPTFIVRGSDDLTVTEDVCEQLKRLTRGTSITIPMAGHDLMLEHSSDIATEKILAWINDVLRGR